MEEIVIEITVEELEAKTAPCHVSPCQSGSDFLD